MPDRLQLEDESQFPIQCFFNAIGDDSFLRMLECLTNGVGYSINECHCLFPSDIDPNDISFEGIRFSLFEQSVDITNDQLETYLRLVCDDFASRYPEQRQRIDSYLGQL